MFEGYGYCCRHLYMDYNMYALHSQYILFFLTTFTILLNEIPHDAQRVWLNTSQFFVCTSTYLCVDDFT